MTKTNNNLKNGDIQFWINPDVDLTKIKDSMQIDSGTTIATCHMKDFYAYIEVRGDVMVFFNPNTNEEPTQGEYYTKPSEFPQELKDLIAKDETWYLDKRVELVRNNWFELFWGKAPTDTGLSSECVSIEEYNTNDIMNLLMYCAEQAKI